MILCFDDSRRASSFDSPVAPQAVTRNQNIFISMTCSALLFKRCLHHHARCSILQMSGCAQQVSEWRMILYCRKRREVTCALAHPSLVYVNTTIKRSKYVNIIKCTTSSTLVHWCTCFEFEFDCDIRPATRGAVLMALPKRLRRF